MPRSLRHLRPLAFLAVGLALVGAGGAPAGPSAPVQGTYRLKGPVQVDARPFPARQQEMHADAVLAPGAAAGQLRLRLSSEGLSCELDASLGADGALAFVPGQRCRVELHGGDVEGAVEARLSAGSGKVRGEELSLSLSFSVSGVVRLSAGGALDSVGELLSLPGAGGSEVPVKGEVRGRVEGRRDRSRAAEG